MDRLLLLNIEVLQIDGYNQIINQIINVLILRIIYLKLSVNAIELICSNIHTRTCMNK